MKNNKKDPFNGVNPLTSPLFENKMITEFKDGKPVPSIIIRRRNLDELFEKEKNNPVQEKATFTDGILKFKNKEINFTNKQNQKDLLNTLFKNPKKNYSYDELQEDWDETGIDEAKYPNDYWRKFYSAGDDIDKAVAIKTQIEDFITKNTKEIRINPKYI